jgi:tripartite-type tricarboxylate transporter receptor subunit TctC
MIGPLRLLFVVVASLVVAPVSAQDYPTRPIKIVVPYPPGGGNDILGRFVAQRLSTTLGQQVFVENKPGAGGRVGQEAGLKSAADGYTLTLISSSYTQHPSLYKLSFDPVSDVTPVIQLAQGPLLFLANRSVRATTIAELIALAKAEPGKITFASAGQGSSIHFAIALFVSMARIEIVHVPYKGMAPALTDTVAGHTDICLSTTPAGVPHVRSGRLRALAVTTTTRLSVLPDVPTVNESGLPGYEAIQWYGLAAPKGLPRSILDRINGDIAAALKLPETAEQFATEGVSPVGGTPEQFLAIIKKEIEIWRRVAKETGMKGE